MDVKPVRLQGDTVCLVPLAEEHVPELARVGMDREIWRFLPYGELTTEAKMLEHVRVLLQRKAMGTDLPFAVIHAGTQRPIGCTRYFEISREHRRLEIGGTWYGVNYQRTKVNTECKYLLLKHAFEELGCIRVQFKANVKNMRSQRAIERLGAQREGIFRNHLILPGGGIRDSVYYSILADEWAQVEQRLAALMARPPQGKMEEATAVSSLVNTGPIITAKLPLSDEQESV